MADTSVGKNASGRCECGGVSYVVDGPLRSVWNCHCHRCRRFTGHHMAASASLPDRVRFISDSTLTWYSPDPSVAYGFCSTCGSSLFWRAAAQPDHLSICAGTLEQPTGLHTSSAWWMAEHGDYHTPEPDLIDFEYEATPAGPSAG
ncbi:MAG TPA: GFA family protein [Ilumatobacteraceae bacterium]|nr:GFA family protein [Ilumatobacteraceae bacterium]